MILKTTITPYLLQILNTVMTPFSQNDLINNINWVTFS
jgi:hypothetical protein